MLHDEIAQMLQFYFGVPLQMMNATQVSLPTVLQYVAKVNGLVMGPTEAGGDGLDWMRHPRVLFTASSRKTVIVPVKGGRSQQRGVSLIQVDHTMEGHEILRAISVFHTASILETETRFKRKRQA